MRRVRSRDSPNEPAKGSPIEMGKYPIFRNPDRYLECRVARTPMAAFGRRAERQALDRCLAGITGIRTICDVSCGPGRLFPYWREKDFRVLGVEMSSSMLDAAREKKDSLGLSGDVIEGDAFCLPDLLGETPDCVACIRFAYYFERAERIRLLRRFAAATRRWVIVEYKTTETLKGQVSLQRQKRKPAAKKPHQRKQACSHEDIVAEVQEAGLVPVRIESLGEFSDRVLVLAQGPGEGGTTSEASETPRVALRRSRRLHLVFLFFVLWAVVYSINMAERDFWSENEAYYALGAKSVLRGDWLLPRIAGNVYSDKPPLFFWIVALISAPLGHVTEWTTRLANLLATLVVLVATYRFGRRTGNKWVGLLAALLLATMYEFWQQATHASTDLTFVALMMLAWTALYQRPFSGVVVSCVPFAVWSGLVYLHLGASPLHTIVIRHNFVRFLNAFDHIKPWYYYLYEMPLSTLPWSVLLPFAAWHLFRTWRSRADRDRMPLAFATTIMAIVLVFFSLSSSKRDYYLLPLMPWFAYVLGIYVWEWICISAPTETVDDSCSEREFLGRMLAPRFGRLLVGGIAIVFAAMAVYSGFVTHYLEQRKSPQPLANAINEAADENDQVVIIDDDDPRIFFYLRTPFELSDDTKEDLDRLRVMMKSGRELDLVVEEGDLGELRHISDVPLFFERKLTFRGDEYYILTNEARPGLRPFL